MLGGLLAEFDSSNTCACAVTGLKHSGLQKLSVYMPYPARDVQKALQLEASPLPRLVFVAGALGASLAYFILWYTNVWDYPINVGGRPDHAIPAFIPIAFETMVLFAGGTAFVGALWLCGLPRLYHPLDEVEGFTMVSVDRFMVGVDAKDANFEREAVGNLLRQFGALAVRDFGEPGTGSEPALADSPAPDITEEER